MKNLMLTISLSFTITLIITYNIFRLLIRNIPFDMDNKEFAPLILTILISFGIVIYIIVYNLLTYLITVA